MRAGVSKVRVRCVDCEQEFLPKGLGPHRGRIHPKSKQLRADIAELIDTEFTVYMLSKLRLALEQSLAAERVKRKWAREKATDAAR